MTIIRNPSEYQRMIEERNDQLEQLEESRNKNTAHHRRCARLRQVRDKMKNGYLCKSDKERLLAEQRKLEKQLGLKSDPYNGRKT